MKRIVTHLALTATMAMLATGCVPVRHNLPPEQRMMEPGPGVGGPGPGVLGPPPYRPMMGAATPMIGGSGSSFDGMPTGNSICETPNASRGMTVGNMPTEISNPEIAQVGYDQIDAQTASLRRLLSGSNGECATGDCGDGAAACGCGGHGGGGSGAGCSSGGQVIPPGGGVMMMSGMPGMISTAQVTFGSPDGMQVRYDVSGSGMFDSEPLVVPARQNFPQGGLYRLKLTNIPSRPGVELYPTVELAYANPRTGAYLAHNSVPLQFSEEDFDQVLTGNFVTKVIYLPDPEFQGPAIAGIDTLVSTRLDPGIDPIVEADRRGSILAIIRLGDKDIEMAGGGMAAYANNGMMGPPITGLPAPFAPAMTDGCGSCGPDGPGAGKVGAPPSLPGMIAGVNAPQYGMPYTGTPIGLPGPPHIPLGAPAGLKSHTIRNHTHMHMPRPVNDVRIDVRQQPGMSYPNPVSRIRVTEQNIHPGVPNVRPAYEHPSQRVY